MQALVTAGEDRAAADRMITVNKINFTQPMPVAYFNRVGTVDGVRQVTYANWFGGYYQDPNLLTNKVPFDGLVIACADDAALGCAGGPARRARLFALQVAAGLALVLAGGSAPAPVGTKPSNRRWPLSRSFSRRRLPRSGS